MRLNILAISYILRSRDLQERYNPCRRGSYTPYPGSVRQSPQSVFFNGTAWRGNQNTITGSGRFYIFWKRTSSMEENKVHTYVGGNKVNLYAYWWVEQGYITRSRRRSLPSCGLTTWTPDGTLLLKWRRPKQERIFGSVMFNAQFAIRYSARYAWLVGVVSRKGGNQYNGTFFADFYFISKFTFFLQHKFSRVGSVVSDAWPLTPAKRTKTGFYLSRFFLLFFMSGLSINGLRLIIRISPNNLY